MTEGGRFFRRLALAAQAACVATVFFYAACRVVQVLSSPAAVALPSPSIFVGARAGYFWRAWTASYAGAMVGFLVFAAARVHEARVARGLVPALWIAVTILVLQTLFSP